MDLTQTIIAKSDQWRPIPGHEGSYEVSDLGKVRSLDRRTDRNVRAWALANPERARELQRAASRRYEAKKKAA